MAETNHFTERLREPLNDTTRKTRRNLLASAVVGVVITRVGLVPEKISAFGIEFTSANQQALIALLIAIILYFSVSFFVYVYSELTAWQIVFTSQEIEALKDENIKKFQSFASYGREAKEEEKFREHVRFLYFRSKPTFYLRLFVELVIPIVFAAYSCYTLITFDMPVGKKPIPSTQNPQKVLPLSAVSPSANPSLKRDTLKRAP